MGLRTCQPGTRNQSVRQRHGHRAMADEISTGRDAAESAEAEQEKSQVVKNCMRGRGYRVLN